MAKCIVFYHPGAEVQRSNLDSNGWTRGQHGRKFLRTTGMSTSDPDVKPKQSHVLFFWGEYEAPTSSLSLIVPNVRKREYPTKVHEVITPIPIRGRKKNHGKKVYEHLSTDPFVFCGPFLYSNCQQLGPINEPRNIQSLKQGDLVLFGSHLEGCFVLDTCLVVRVSTTLNSYQKQVQTGGVFDLVTNRLIRGLPVTVFEGATWSKNNPFSFVPCWNSLNGGQGHPRPVLVPTGALSKVITPTQRRGIKGLSANSNPVQPIFDEVVKQVLSQGCLLGTYIDHPQCRDASGTHAQDKAQGQPLVGGKVC